jgi:hypothetical protein
VRTGACEQLQQRNGCCASENRKRLGFQHAARRFWLKRDTKPRQFPGQR